MVPLPIPRIFADNRHTEQVNAIEVANPPHISTVKTILLCHSMGGIIGVDTILTMSSDKDLLLPTILGIIAYDTPYFGLNPPVIHRTISTRVNTVSNVYNTAKEWIPASLLTTKSLATTNPGQQSQPPSKKWGWGKTVAAATAATAALGAMTYFA